MDKWHWNIHRNNSDTSVINEFIYSALSIYGGLISPNNPRKIPIARPLRRGMVVFREFLVLTSDLLFCVQYDMLLFGDISTVSVCNTYLANP